MVGEFVGVIRYGVRKWDRRVIGTEVSGREQLSTRCNMAVAVRDEIGEREKEKRRERKGDKGTRQR